MESVQKSIEVDVPVSTAYNQWTQYEEFPRFMEGVKEVHQVDDARLHWRAEVAGKEAEWDAEITSQVPDERVAWRSISGATNAGIVTFHPIDDGHTRIDLRIEYDTEGVIEKVGDLLGAVDRRVAGDLDRFKEFIETRGSETGEWRGSIQSGEVKRGGSSERPASERLSSERPNTERPGSERPDSEYGQRRSK